MFSPKDSGDSQVTGIAAPPTKNELKEDFEKAIVRLQEVPQIREIILETEIADFIPKIELIYQADN